MTDDAQIDVDSEVPTNAVSILGDGAEDFPVLKAFQQYIDAEQNKARKRMISLCIFFGCLMTIVIVVFLIILMGVSQRNQALNDKLFEYLIKDRDRQSSAVVVQPQADHSAVYGLTAKLEEIQKKLANAEAAEQERKEVAAQEAAKAIAAEKASRQALEKARIKEELEIERLKEELAAERAKASQEREKKRQEEIEAYRRKYYPDLYERKVPSAPSRKTKKIQEPAYDEADQEIDAILEEFDENDSVNYFEEDDNEGRPLPRTKQNSTASKPASYSIPVEVKGVKAKWRIPND